MIENMLHKHRYFGHSGEIYESCPWSVTTVSPMKRGLKDNFCICLGITLLCYNRFPDEKGTERRETDKFTGFFVCVTTVSPMKRGLKEQHWADITRTGRRYNRFPDEKGTESPRSPAKASSVVNSYNRFPDEKGTERMTQSHSP